MSHRKRHSNIRGRGGRVDLDQHPKRPERLRPLNEYGDESGSGVFIFLAVLAIAFLFSKLL